MLSQGTSLPKEVAEQLDDMFEHKPLGAASDTIKHQYKKLRKWQVKLGQRGHEANQQMEVVLRRQVLCKTHLLTHPVLPHPPCSQESGYCLPTATHTF